MADIIKLAIDKLNNDNYQSWKYEAELVLRRESTWHTITDEVPSATDEKVYTMWKSADSKAIGTIGLLVEKNQHVHIRKAKSAKEVWNNLKEQHEKSTLSSAVHMYRQLASMKLSEADNVENLIQAVQETADKLIAVGEPLTERFIMGMMLANLPNSYGTLITALECRAEADLNIGMVREKIIGEFRRRKESEKDCTVAVTSEAVLAIKTDKGTSVKNKTKAICHFCKKQGHFKSKCFKFKALQQEKLQAAKITTQTMSGGAKEVNSEAEHFCFKTERVEKNKWYIDSGATCHMTNSNEYFESLDTSVSEIVRVANGDTITAKGIGNLWLNCENNVGKMQMILLKNVRYVPELNGNLLSVRTLTKQGLDVHFNAEKCSIMKDDKTAAIAIPRNQLYELQCTQDALLTCFSNKEICLHNWHRRLGHRNPEAVKLLEQQSLANGIKISKCKNIMFCDTCAKGKLARLPFPKTSETKTKSLLDLLYSDLCGPMQTQTPGGKRYILTLVDDYSRYCNIYLLARKSEVCEKIKEFVQFCCNNFGCKPKIIRSDRGGEYLNERLSTFFKSQGIQHQLTAPFSPQQNGVAEQKNRSLTEMARCMLIDAVLPNQFWGEAVMTANYLQNRLPTKAIEGTPFEKWYGTKPDLKHIRIFGSKVYMHIPDEQRRKLDNKACELTFVGYAESSKAYRLLNTKTKRIFISRDVKFVETSHGGMSIKECKHEMTNPDEDDMSNKECKQEVTNLEDDQCRGDKAGSKFQIDLEIDELTELPSEEMEETLRRSSRSSKGIPPQRLIQTCNLILDEPRSYKEAMAGPEMVQWKLAMEDELQSLSSNNVWKLCELPPGRQAISGKWVFKKKLDEHGNISRYKARYVAKGFSQKYGEDYDEVFAPVAKQTTFRTLLTVAGKFKMHVKHYDFKTAFLNGKIEEDLFLKQPEGFAESGNEHLVCKLQKSIYGLKQAARAWNKTLHKQLTNIRFSNSDISQ